MTLAALPNAGDFSLARLSVAKPHSAGLTSLTRANLSPRTVSASTRHNKTRYCDLLGNNLRDLQKFCPQVPCGEVGCKPHHLLWLAHKGRAQYHDSQRTRTRLQDSRLASVGDNARPRPCLTSLRTGPTLNSITKSSSRAIYPSPGSAQHSTLHAHRLSQPTRSFRVSFSCSPSAAAASSTSRKGLKSESPSDWYDALKCYSGCGLCIHASSRVIVHKPHDDRLSPSTGGGH